MEVPKKFQVKDTGKPYKNEGASDPRNQQSTTHNQTTEGHVWLKVYWGLTWYKYLVDGHIIRDFKQSLIGPCLMSIL
jgi:hypothetical protein